MFLAVREIFHAKGRFSLITAVIAMMTLLLIMLTGLTAGLGAQNTSALQALDADRVVFSAEQNPDGSTADPSFANSQITASQAEDWAEANGVDHVAGLGASQTTMETDFTSSIALLSLPEGTAIPSGETVRPGTALVSQSVADDHELRVGETITVGSEQVEVAGMSEDEYYSHSPVVWTDTDTWAAATHQQADAETVVGTVLLVQGTEPDEADGSWSTTAENTDTLAVTPQESFSALPAHQSEQGSLVSMQGFLYVISALVIVSFLTVWTLQRTRELSVLRALGASGTYLFKDALGQAGIILAVGVIIGTLAGSGLGALAAGVLPFELTWLTLFGPMVGIWALGMIGGLIATRKVATVNPLEALGTAA
ncbi:MULTISPECIES: ABC transporter permease [Auritidibacter]|uniref:ABC transporter permease n=1 Tax=Auritidibacter TaxID=1160973 RepID=UPI000D7284C0|nr:MULTISPECIES: ABC transporter permease [Auritidibacter]PXA76353.1 ABC transporter permease [Auritidibacter sp. NML120779]AXR74713.1 ABC transporter permease [Auritidibacter sp. NML130574]NIH71098.1 putative ABC transport system permease protein [Auritidibacter ignavus]PXA79255.1 ABC transporter permease [Auritidibacter sp. NML120636]RMX22378.1 ABC transporter permease [Auritidibacter ignavus]